MDRPLRVPSFEREAILVASRGLDADLILAVTQSRADAGGPYRRPRGWDARREVLEELADAANYLPWWMQDVQEGVSAADPKSLAEALSAVCHAFGVIQGEPPR